MNQKIQYIIHYNEGTVTAKATGCKLDAVIAVLRPLSGVSSLPINPELACLSNTLRMNDEYYGTARLAPGDTFDLQTGKAIARKKMHAKYAAAKTKAIAKYLAELTKYQKSVLASFLKFTSHGQ